MIENNDLFASDLQSSAFRRQVKKKLPTSPGLLILTSGVQQSGVDELIGNERILH